MSLADVRALAFDVFGTVVDWHGSIAREAEQLLKPKGYDLDWGKFARAWRQEYQPAMEAVRAGRRPYVVMDQLHLEMLEVPLAKFGVKGLSVQEKMDFSHAWRRLDPWPDTVEGMTRLKKKMVVAAVSNGNIALVLPMAKRGGIPWDLILGADFARTYKPEPAMYDTAVQLMGFEPGQVMMVACHVWDLDAAAKRGMKTAFVARPLEWGPDKEREAPAPGAYDVMCGSFVELAERLGA